MTGRQLFEYGSQFKEDIKSFHNFRERSVLKLMFLHNKRRARLLIYFAFMKYKTQVYKEIIADQV